MTARVQLCKNRAERRSNLILRFSSHQTCGKIFLSKFTSEREEMLLRFWESFCLGLERVTFSGRQKAETSANSKGIKSSRLG